MADFSIPYYELLIRLALYQKDVDVPVQFQFQSVSNLSGKTNAASMEKSAVIMVQPLLAERPAYDTLPLFNFPDLDPIQLWLSFGFIVLVSGSVRAGKGVFTLTEQSLGLDLIQFME